MLKHITFRNFKKHTELDLPLNSGLTALTGPNAAGKSTILKGILYALFGGTVAGAKEHIWKWGSDNKREVALKITLPEHGEVLVRRTPSGATITSIDGRVLAAGGTAVTKFIEEALGMLAEDIKTLCYSGQGETQGLLSMGPTSLQQKIEGLSRADVVDRVIDHVSRDMLSLQGRLEGLPDNLDIAGLETRIQLLQEKKLTVEADLKKASEICEMTELDKVAAKRELEKAVHDNAGVDKLEAQRGFLESTLKQAEDRLSGLKTNFEQVEKFLEGKNLPAAESRLIGVHSTVQDIEKARLLVLSSAKSRKDLQADLAVCRADLEAHTKATELLEALNEQWSEISKNYGEANDQWLKADQEYVRYAQMFHDAKCPTCRRDFENVDSEELHAKADEWQRKSQEFKTTKDALWVRHAQVNNQITDVSKALRPGIEDRIRLLEQRLGGLPDAPEGRAEELLVQLSQLEQERKDLNLQVQQLKLALSDRQRLSEAVSKETAARDQASSDLAAWVAELAGKARIDIAPLETTYNGYCSKLEQYGQIRGDYRTNLAVLEQDLGGTNRELESARRFDEERKKVSESLADLTGFQKYLKSNRARWTEGLWDGLLQYASALVSNTTGGALSNIERSPKGEFTIDELGMRVPVKEASGFQKSLVGMALRVALSKVFYGDNLFLLLDEATADARDDNAAAVAGLLASLNMQIVMVSHRIGDAVNAGTLVELE